MSSGTIRRTRRMLPWPGLLVCVLALVSQLALGAVVLPETSEQAGIAALEAAMVLCQSGTASPAAPHAPAPRHRHHERGCALCPLAVALALPAVIPVADPVLPGPGDALPFQRVHVAQARAPPSLPYTAAYPRGPPVLA